MISPDVLAKAFLQTFDGSARALFGKFLAHNLHVTKWMISADFALHDPARPLDCMSFTLLPYDRWPDEISADINAALPKDLKHSKELPPAAAAWLRDSRRFHIVVTMNKDHRTVFYNTPNTAEEPIPAALDVAREHIELSINALFEQPDTETTKRFKKLRQEARAKNFNVGLLSNIWLLGFFFAMITAIIGRDRQSEIVGWFPDRDDMTNWCDGIWQDYAFNTSKQLAQAFDIDLSRTKTTAGAPDRSGSKEEMWFDYMIRSADWFAGAIATWNRETNQTSGDQPKYRQMLEDVVADADNIIVLHGDLRHGTAQFRRIVVQKG